MRKFWKWFLISILGIFVICQTTCYIVAGINLKHNTKVWNELNYQGIIYNQHNFKNLKYGFGNIASNGCGAVAVYNILVLENRYKPFPQIINYFDKYGENVFGILGTNPIALILLLKYYGYKVNFSLNSSKFNNMAKNSKYSILLNVNSEYGHYELLYNYNETDETYVTINSYGKSTMSNLLKNYKNNLLVLITVNK